ncbi:MAG: NAD(+)/NADH kinase [Coriobacteriales bacterium]|jgi:NAD+ kinase|nr:NAD(+)/NADH kinase [Coriobacteriales bacterium]
MKVLLITNTTKDLTSQVVVSLCEWLTNRGIDYEYFSSGIFEEGKTRFDELAFSIEQFDLVCSFGGDGTTLRAAHLVGGSGVPLLSYNFGRLGFLSGAGRADLIPAMEAAIDGRLSYDARTLLEVSVTYKDGRSDRQIALNEVVVSRGHFGRIVALDLAINGVFIDTIKGDGVLVATPTGSTAYSLSAGGPIIAPAHEGLCVVPISPHSLKSRAVITTKDDTIRLSPSKANAQRLVLFIDGEVFWVYAGDKGDGSALAGAPGSAGAGAGAPGSGASGSSIAPAAPSVSASTCASVPGFVAGDEIISVEIGTCAEKLRLARYGDYNFYDHISRTFFRGEHA